MSADGPSRRICLTGPASETAARRWTNAVLTASGWTPIHLPLVRIVPVPVRLPAIPEGVSFVAVTSQNALPALKRIWKQRPDVRDAPHAAVGISTARAMRALGVDPAVVCDPDDSGARQLAEEIVERTERGQTIVWPRGDRARDLRETLERAGRGVRDPVAYRTEDVTDAVLPGRLDAVFFASPSAAKVWLSRADVPRVDAITIGPTTHAEIASEYARFRTMIRLPAPSPRALAEALATLRP
ncbi:MAG: uroporphyrinogen-III synthase [Planctomycetota bacterium]